LQLAQELEREKLDLEDRLEEAHLRNGELVQLGLAAARASSERDAVEIATLEARLRTANERHQVTVDTTRADREQLAKAEYLLKSRSCSGRLPGEGLGPGGEEPSQLPPPLPFGRPSVRGERLCYQNLHGLGAFRPAETGGFGGDVSTATTEEDATAASRDL
jgi:hypothetical protein